MRFPGVIGQIITDYAHGYKLLDWVNPACLQEYSAWSNIRAYELGLLDTSVLFKTSTSSEAKKIIIYFLASNAAAWGFIYDNKEMFNVPSLWANPRLLDSGWRHYCIPCSNIYLMRNTNPTNRVVTNSCDGMSFMNPVFAEIFQYKPSIIDYKFIWGNSSPLIVEKYLIPGVEKKMNVSKCISWNSHPWALEYMRNNPEVINLFGLGQNSGIFVDDATCRAKQLGILADGF